MNYAEKVWDTINRAWNGDLKAQLSLLCVDVALNGDSRLIKEEKKMLNFYKYREAIMSEDVDTNELDCHIAALRGIKDCGNCECDACMRESFRWLFSEYEPQLLKNGDGLKPGDWIMVKDPNNEVWVKKIFAYYYDGNFYCANDIAFFKNGLLINRTKARLPEDGE